MKRILKYINSLPVPFTMKHYQVFDAATPHLKDRALVSVESWEVLRREHPFFSISNERAEWLQASEVQIKKDGQDSDLIIRARAIADLVKSRGYARIFSVGVGGAALEYQIKKMLPQISMTCSDYSPETVSRLRNVFTEADQIIQFDLLEGDWSAIQKNYLGEKGLCLMYRVDAGFSDEEWKRIFKKISDAGVRTVLFVPTGVLSLLSIYNRKRRELKWFVTRTPIVWAGYLRTEKRFAEFWKPFYNAKRHVLGNLKSYELKSVT